MRVIFIFILFLLQASGTDNPRVRPSDLALLTGTPWTGELTYLDYSSGKKTTIPAGLTVSRSAQNKYVWYFRNEYPKEPHANSTDTVILSRNGAYIGKERVLENTSMGKARKKIVTEKTAVQDGKEMVYRYFYEISSNLLVMRKEEQRRGDTVFIERNRYTFQRNR